LIETSAAHVKIADEVKITTASATGAVGHWLIDPFDFSIAASGGDITGAALGALLDNNSITIQTANAPVATATHLTGAAGSNGDIFVNDAVSWSASNSLTLDAYRDIKVNANLSASASGANILLKAGHNIDQASNVVLTTNGGAITFNSDSGAIHSGAIRLNSNAQVITHGGDITMGGGSNPLTTAAYGNSADSSEIYNGISLDNRNVILNAGGGNISLNGNTPYYTGGVANNWGTQILTTGNGSIRIVGTSTNLSTWSNSYGVGLDRTTISAQNGAITIIGSVQAPGMNAVVQRVGNKIESTGSGAINITGIGGNVYLGGWGVQTVVGGNSATGDITLTTDAITLSDSNYRFKSSGALTIQPYTAGTNIGIGSGAGTLQLPTDYFTTNFAPGFSTVTVGNANTGNIAIGGLNSLNNNTSIVGGRDVNVTGAVTWAANTLTLAAQHNININANLNGSGTASLAFEYGLGASDGVIGSVAANYNLHAAVNLDAGEHFSTRLGSAGSLKHYTVITSLGAEGSSTGADLQGINGNLSANYALGSNIDASDTSSWNAGQGFQPISVFTGNFDGLGHAISNLSIHRPSGSEIGLFGKTNTAAVIRNVGLVASSVTGYGSVGALVGWNAAAITNSYVNGDVTGFGDYIGGLVGGNKGKITNSYANAAVVGAGSHIGGLVGGSESSGSIANSYATGNVTGGSNVGGLLGFSNFSSSITNSYATGSVTGNFVGGLVGYNFGGAVSNSYATGSVSGTGEVGQLLGHNTYGTILNSYWNNTVIGAGVGGGYTSGAQGLSIAAMRAMSSFSNWDIANTGGSGAVWRIYEGHTAPLLTSFMTGLTLNDAANVAMTYNGNSQSGASSAQGGVLGAAASGTHAGFYNGYYSTQQGYDISGGNLTISAAALSLSGSRAYDGTANVAAGIFALSGLVNGEDLIFTGVGTIASKNIGTYGVGLGSLTLGNGSHGLASDYKFTGGTQTATISKADLSVTAAGFTKTYNSSLMAGGSASIGALAGAAAGESVLSRGSQAFLDKNAGSGNKIVRASGVTIQDAAGLDVTSNYTLAYTDNTTSTIRKADLAVTGLNALGKVYDATTGASLAGSASISKLGSDDVALGGSAVGTFASKNVGSQGVTVTGNTLSGSDAGNYNLRQQTGLTASITQAQLSYQATPANFLNGQTPNGLSGTVNGFAGSDSLANATSGQLAWTTSANEASKPGSYAIAGRGLLASNYTFSQAARNAGALTLGAAVPLAPVLQARTQLTTTTVASPASAAPTPLSMSPAITVTQTTTVEGSGSSAKPEQPATANTAMSIGATGPSLQIVNGGMRLPLALANFNE
jgi:hypothetical protein